MLNALTRKMRYALTRRSCHVFLLSYLILSYFCLGLFFLVLLCLTLSFCLCLRHCPCFCLCLCLVLPCIWRLVSLPCLTCFCLCRPLVSVVSGLILFRSCLVSLTYLTLSLPNPNSNPNLDPNPIPDTLRLPSGACVLRTRGHGVVDVTARVCHETFSDR